MGVVSLADRPSQTHFDNGECDTWPMYPHLGRRPLGSPDTATRFIRTLLYTSRWLPSGQHGFAAGRLGVVINYA
jgi:hypothetical protein